MQLSTTIIAIAGGSGSGKSWLAQRLQRQFGDSANRISLDDFYRDCSRLPMPRRNEMNFDHPRAIDWEAFHQALVDSRAGRSVHVPHYDFASHTRLPVRRIEPPRPLVIVDGLWLFLLPSVRECFDLRIFLNCPEQLRLEQRLARDLKERGRSPESVREQFWRTVAPMHNRYVRRQACLADVVLNQPPSEQEIRGLENMIRARLPDNSLLVETLSGQPSLIGSPMDAVAYQSRTIPF